MTTKTAINLLPILAVCFTTICVSSAGTGRISGESLTTWNEDKTSVIIARVATSEKGIGFDVADCAVLVPLATLAGGIDPTSSDNLKVRFYSETANTSILKRPETGDMVIAVIQVGRLHADETKPSNWVPSDYCDFMPHRSAMVAIRGMGDDAVHEVIKKLRTSREAGREQSATRPVEEASDVERLYDEDITPSERLYIAANTTEPKALHLLARYDAPFNLQLLIILNPFTPIDIVKAYEHSEHPVLKAAAEWSLEQHHAKATTQSTIRSSD